MRSASKKSLVYKRSEIDRWQWLSPERLQSIQQERLAQLLFHAYHHVPYYTNLLRDAGAFRAAGIYDSTRFHAIPLLNRQDLNRHFESLKSDDLSTRKWKHNSTGGSTGEPVRFIQDRDHAEWCRAIREVFDQWSGYEPGDGKVRLWGSRRDFFVGQESFGIRLGRWLRNEVWLNSCQMTSDDMRQYIRQINSYRPRQILGYAESLYELACFAESEGLSITPPHSIMSAAGTLYENMRSTIQRVYGAPVFNRYGSRDAGDIACDCANHEGLHVASFNFYLEILDDNGNPSPPGELGELVVTPLTNYSMPLIRYRIDDMGTWSKTPCSCGRGLPLMIDLAGRVTDHFLTRTGRLIDGRVMVGVINSTLFRHAIARRYQVVQDTVDHILVRLELKGKMDSPLIQYAKELQEITDKIHSCMGEDCRVEFAFPSHIEPTPSGKHRFTVSKVRERNLCREVSQ